MFQVYNLHVYCIQLQYMYVEPESLRKGRPLYKGHFQYPKKVYMYMYMYMQYVFNFADSLPTI